MPQAPRIHFSFSFFYFFSSQESTDTESSTTSTEREPTEPAAGIADDKGQQNLNSGTSQSGLQLSVAPCMDLEAKEVPRTNPQFFTSITIATRRRTPSPDHSSSSGPPLSPSPEPLRLSQLSGETLPGLELNLMNEAAASQCSRLHLDKVQLKSRALPSVEVTRSPRPGSVPTLGDHSCGHVTASPKPAVEHSLPPPGQPKHSSSLLSPDEGLGLSSPPEWFEHREPMKERAQSSSSIIAPFQPVCEVPGGEDSALLTTFRLPTTVTSPRDVKTAEWRNSESPGETTHTHIHTKFNTQCSA